MGKREDCNVHQAVTAVLAQRAKWRVEKARLPNTIIVRCKTRGEGKDDLGAFVVCKCYNIYLKQSSYISIKMKKSAGKVVFICFITSSIYFVLIETYTLN